MSWIICPSHNLSSFLLLIALMTWRESPSTSTDEMLIYWAKMRARLTARASTIFTELGRGIRWLRAIMINPYSSLITIPKPARAKFSKIAPSKFILNRPTKRGCQRTTLHGNEGLAEGRCTSQNFYSNSLALLTVCPTSHTDCFTCNLLRRVWILQAIIENRVAVLEDVSVRIKDTRSPKLLNTLLRSKVKVWSDNQIHLA